MRVSVYGDQWETRMEAHPARSRFRSPFFPNEDGSWFDELPSLDAGQPSGDQRQDPPGDGFEDNVAVAGVPNANVGQGRCLHPIYELRVRGVEEGGRGSGALL